MNSSTQKALTEELGNVRDKITELKQREHALLTLLKINPEKKPVGRPLGWRKSKSQRTPARAMHEAILKVLPPGQKLNNGAIRALLKSSSYPYALSSELVRNALSDLKTESPPKVLSENSGPNVVYWLPS